MGDDRKAGAWTAPRDRDHPIPWLGLAGVLVLAAGLRIAGARGDLWFDEVWSVDLIRPIETAAGIFTAINHDNNHFLNSLWMWTVGLDAAPLALRAASIVLGLVAVLAAGLIGARRSPATALLSALAVAIAYGEVHYASEARGWSGMIAVLLIEILLIERALPDRTTPLLAVAIGLLAVIGLGWQMFLLPSLFVLGLWALNAVGMRTHDPRAALGHALATFWVAAIGVVAVLAGLAWLRRAHGFTGGGLAPFTLSDLLDGYGTMIASVAGLPVSVPPVATLIGAAVLLGLAVALTRGRDDDRVGLWIAFLVGLPVLMIAVRLPNVDMARYHLAGATVFLLMLADLVATAWSRGGAGRLLAVVVATGFVLGNGWSLARFLGEGRGHFTEAVARIGAEGPIVASGDHDLRGSKLLLHHARRLGLEARWIESEDLCRDLPRWLLVEDSWRWNERMRPIVEHCPIAFGRAFRVDHWGLSGASWTVYRVEGRASVLSEVDPQTP